LNKCYWFEIFENSLLFFAAVISCKISYLSDLISRLAPSNLLRPIKWPISSRVIGRKLFENFG